jgi:hypothetical protein
MITRIIAFFKRRNANKPVKPKVKTNTWYGRGLYCSNIQEVLESQREEFEKTLQELKQSIER